MHRGMIETLPFALGLKKIGFKNVARLDSNCRALGAMQVESLLKQQLSEH